MGIEESEDADSIENDVGLHLDFLGQRESVRRVDFRPYYFFLDLVSLRPFIHGTQEGLFSFFYGGKPNQTS